jgi:hypothetical protein
MPLTADANNSTYWVRKLFSATSINGVSATQSTLLVANLKIFLQNKAKFSSKNGKSAS